MSLMTEPKQYLGYTHGDRVRDARSGQTGHVRVCDDEEVGRYAEVAWTGSFVSDELEVAIDNGISKSGDFGREENDRQGYLMVREPPTEQAMSYFERSGPDELERER